MRACYLDASALVKFATPEPETDALRGHCSLYDICLTSRLADVEVTRALVRRGLQSATLAGAVREALNNLSILEFDAATAEAAGRIGPPTLRSLDAIHLASAVAVRGELDALITYDLRLADAAREAGFEVLAPA